MDQLPKVIGLAAIVFAVVVAYYLGFKQGKKSGKDAGFSEGKREGSKRGFLVGYDRGKRAREEKDDSGAEPSKSKGCAIVFLLAALFLVVATLATHLLA